MKKDDVCGCLGPVVKGGLLYFLPEKQAEATGEKHALLTPEVVEILVKEEACQPPRSSDS